MHDLLYRLTFCDLLRGSVDRYLFAATALAIILGLTEQPVSQTDHQVNTILYDVMTGH